MSSNEETTDIIEEKKLLQSKVSNEYISKILAFIKSITYVIIHILLYFSCSGLILYVCKIAQSNILPTEIKCFPYTNDEPKITPIKTNIFTTWTDPIQSMKLEFPFNEYNKSNKILDLFREYKEKSNSNFLANYFIAIIETIIHVNYNAFNTIFNIVNEFPEFLIVILGPILLSFILFFLFLFNQLYIIYSWFSNMSWFFKTNTNDTSYGKPKWEDVNFSSPINFGFAITLSILFIVLFFVAYPILSFITFICLGWCIFSCLSYKSLLNDKNINALNIIIELIKYYKISIVIILSLFIILYAFSKLGATQGVFACITLLLIYLGFLKFDLFKPINEENIGPLVSYKQAKKICNFTSSINKSSKFLNFFGGSITKQLKKINNMTL